MAQIKRLAVEERDQLASLLNMKSAGDATAAYYALHHPARRVELFVSYGGGGKPVGFLVLARTGLDLFRPLAVPFVASPFILQSIMREGLAPDRQVILFLALEQREWIGEDIQLSGERIGELFRLDPMGFNPIINVLVMGTHSPDGLPRYEIRSSTGAHAVAGVNWVGDPFAEIYLEANEEAYIRDFALSVLAAISNHLINDGKIPLFRLDNTISLNLESLERIGYRSTGMRVLIADARLSEIQV